MALSSRRSVPSDKVAMSPVLLAAVFGLLWFALFPGDGGDLEAPDWGIPIIIGARLLAGFVAGWVVISITQVVLRLAWMGAAHVYAWTRGGR